MKKNPFITIAKRKIGIDYHPFVIAEIGINHSGEINKAKKMIDDAAKAGAECVKFQSHIVEDEMVESEARKTIPANSKISIWEVMEECALTEAQERELKKYTESKGLIFLSTPFSRAAANRLHKIEVKAFKIGSGECNNYPLIEHVAKWRKPMIISTGMNDINDIKETVRIVNKYKTPFALLHCTNMYPTPNNMVQYGGLIEMRKSFPNIVIGLSNHSFGPWTALGAVSLGASILERHFTSDKAWEGNDIEVSMDPVELKMVLEGSRAIWEARGGKKGPVNGERPTIDFAFASVVTIASIKRGEKFTMKNLWVKRPGTGELHARELKKILGKKARRDLKRDVQLKRGDVV